MSQLPLEWLLKRFEIERGFNDVNVFTSLHQVEVLWNRICQEPTLVINSLSLAFSECLKGLELNHRG